MARRRMAPALLSCTAAIAGIAALLAGCSIADPDGAYEFSYPLGVGNQWHFEREYSTSGIPECAIGEHLSGFADSSDVWAWVSGTSSLPDSVEATVLRESITKSGETHEVAHYYVEQSDGLYLHAYKPGDTAVAPGFDSAAQLFFKGVRVSGPSDVAALLQGESPFACSRPDTIIYEDPPLLALPSPLEIGDSWTYREPGNPFEIGKRVLGTTWVRVPAGIFRCYEVEWLIDFDADGQWDDDTEFIDYISRVGLVRRSLSFELVATSPEGDTLGVYWSLEESDLLSVDLGCD